MHLLKYLKTKKLKGKAKCKIIIKKYEQFIYKKKQKILFLALNFKNISINTIVRMTIVITNIKIK